MQNPLFDALLAPHRGSDDPFIMRPDRNSLTYGEFFDAVTRTAGALKSRGLSPGDRLALQVGKSVEALHIYAACLMTGVIFLPLNTAYTADEIAYFLSDAEPGLFICDPDRRSELSRVAGKTGTELLTLSQNNTGSFADLVADADPIEAAEPCSPNDIAALLYTSGTTGRSKGAMLTQENLLSNAQVLVEEWRIAKQDRLLHALPIFHAHGLFVAVNTTLTTGASMIFLPAFQIDAVLDALPDATTMMGIPTFYTRLLDDSRFNAALVRTMRLFVSGSAPLLADTHDRFAGRTGHRILERYGMTETGMNVSNPHDGERRAGTVGFPLPGVELRITDPDTGRDVPDGEIGVIEVRGPNVFKGYWGMPEKTREEIRENGFFITGDLASRDLQGYVRIVGRNKDLIITGGYNVYPKEVEMVIDEVDWVRESAVVGVPHPDFGEGVIALVVPENGAAPNLQALRERIAGGLAKFKQPKEIILIDELPRNTMGKVQKNVLRDDYADLFMQKRAG
ncbi:MAG: malonyl-CoA synthase [Pseudomonadota bacterium]